MEIGWALESRSLVLPYLDAPVITTVCNKHKYTQAYIHTYFIYDIIMYTISLDMILLLIQYL